MQLLSKEENYPEWYLRIQFVPCSKLWPSEL